MMHGHFSSSLLESPESCVAVHFLCLLLFAEVEVVSGRPLTLFLCLAVEVDGCASSFELRFLCFCPSEFLMVVAIFAAAFAALAEEFAAADFSLFSNSTLYGDPVNKHSMLRGKTPTIGILPHTDGRRFTSQANIELKHILLYYSSISLGAQYIIKKVLMGPFCLPMALSDRITVGFPNREMVGSKILSKVCKIKDMV